VAARLCSLENISPNELGRGSLNSDKERKPDREGAKGCEGSPTIYKEKAGRDTNSLDVAVGGHRRPGGEGRDLIKKTSRSQERALRATSEKSPTEEEVEKRSAQKSFS